MTKSVQVHLGAVQETLRIPLLARARETERRRGLLRDPRAVELVRSLDYDFDKWEGGRSLKGAMLRARMSGCPARHSRDRTAFPRRHHRLRHHGLPDGRHAGPA